MSTPSPVDDTPRTPPPAGGLGADGRDPAPSGPGGPAGAGPDGSGPEKPSGPQRTMVRYSLALTGLLAAAIICSMLSLPFVMLSGLLAVAAMICAIICLIAGLRAKQAPQAIVTGGIGFLVAGYVFVSAISTAFIWDIRASYEECSADAITEQSRAVCQQEYNEKIGDWFENLTGQPLPGSPAD